jgi:hypothetical protein
VCGTHCSEGSAAAMPHPAEPSGPVVLDPLLLSSFEVVVEPSLLSDDSVDDCGLVIGPPEDIVALAPDDAPVEVASVSPPSLPEPSPQPTRNATQTQAAFTRASVTRDVQRSSAS